MVFSLVFIDVTYQGEQCAYTGESQRSSFMRSLYFRLLSCSSSSFALRRRAGIDAQASDDASGKASWLSSAQDNLRRAEYQITWQEKTYLSGLAAAYQRRTAHNLRTFFTGQDPRDLTPLRSKSGLGMGHESFQLWQTRKTGAVGYPRMAAQGNRFDYQYHCAIREWYVNDERGLEQGFTVNAPPNKDFDDPLVLELVITGSLHSELSMDGQSVDFVTGRGARVLRYSDLYVFDSAGKALPSWMELSQDGQALQIFVDDSAAVYPITVDPLALPPSWPREQPGGAELGVSICIHKGCQRRRFDDVILGRRCMIAGLRTGAAWIYHGSASGLNASAGWTVMGDADNAKFGRSVDSAGDVDGMDMPM
jgi:hypothetical protein